MEFKIIKVDGSFENDNGKKVNYTNYYVVNEALMIREKISIPKENKFLKDLFISNLEAVAEYEK